MNLPHKNQRGTYEIFIVRTGEVLETCRLKATTHQRISELKLIIKEEMQVRKVK